MPKKSKDTPIVELDRIQTFGHVEILRSDGRRTRYPTFGSRHHKKLSPGERAARRRQRRGRKRAQRAKVTRVRALLRRHGIDPGAVRFCWRG
jgi:hypothetical protein